MRPRPGRTRAGRAVGGGTFAAGGRVDDIIAHRRNTIAQLKETPKQYGVELDIRSFGNELTIHHDPFIQGESFVEWITHYAHETLILNIKV